jgi:hypothetical protein
VTVRCSLMPNVADEQRHQQRPDPSACCTRRPVPDRAAACWRRHSTAPISTYPCPRQRWLDAPRPRPSRPCRQVVIAALDVRGHSAVMRIPACPARTGS